MDTTLSPPAGQLLDGRYRVEAQLARGGMASVYLATDTRLDRTVALKIAHPELAVDEEFVRRFIGEARSAARLSSPHVVAVYDQGSDGRLHYLAMEYVRGQTLRELLNERDKLSPREALDIIDGVLSGLAVAHESGIVHRDVKPENVLLTRTNVVKVADFGLARAAAVTGQTKAGMIIGTAAYLAPEQVSASASDTRTDVYAVGIMLFEMLTGRQPHTGDTPLAVAYKHVNETVLPPSSLVPGLPGALDALVALATSRNPDLRPADAGHFLEAVTAVRRGMPIPAELTGPHSAAAGEYDQGRLPAGPDAATWGSGTYDASNDWGSGAHANGWGSGTRAPSSWDSGRDTSSGWGSRADASDADTGDSRTVALNGITGPDGGPRAIAGPASGAADSDAAGRAPYGLAALGFGPADPASPGPQGETEQLRYGSGGPPGADGPGGGYRGANHTLIVPTGEIGPGWGDQHDGRGRNRSRRQHEPALQRWLFSRRLLYVVLAIILVLAAWLGVGWFVKGQYTTVPHVGGMTTAAARTELRNVGFAVHLGSGEHSATPAGEVIRTRPSTGSRAKHGSTITIISSLGPAYAQIPAVTGISLASAEAALKELGLTAVTTAPATSTTIPAGTVISTSPVAGTSWPKTKPVAITVSAGPPLPDFAGQQVQAAEATAQAGGYALNPVQEPKGAAPQGTIVRQSPAPGSAISPHEVVTVYASPGPPLVTVPHVTGMHATKAVAALQQAGFNVQVNKSFVGDTVLSYSPTGQAPQGSTITINVGFNLP
jgi:serine/threonine-protein kinase